MQNPLDIPDMGSHIMIDFVGIQDFDLDHPAQMILLLEDALKQTDCTLCAKTQAVHEQGKGFSLLFLLSESHLSVHTWPAKNTFTLDFYNVRRRNKRVFDITLLFIYNLHLFTDSFLLFLFVLCLS
jgi:S-adenosylmethionine/arginine decarboxylase-like enzyme